jgi:nucleotide-binding universal stress UspA family protein
MTMPEDSKAARIVAGVDGTPSSLDALSWAIGQAVLTGATVDAVIAWRYPDLAASGGYGLVPPGADGSYGLPEIADKTLTEAISGTLGPASGVHVRPWVIEGHAARALLDASVGAELLVVGSRGHGGFAEALLGSVSQHCVQHASCPVVVIRGQDAA